LQDVIVTVLFAATVHVAAFVPHEVQTGEPVVGVCKPYPVLQAVIVILLELVAETVQVATLLPHRTQLGELPDGEYKPYPVWHVVIVTFKAKAPL